MPDRGINPMKDLKAIGKIKNETKKIVYFMGWLTHKIQKRGLPPPILVGGSALEIYTAGKYSSGDIDIVSSCREEIKKILLDSGFFSQQGRYFVSEKLGMFIEIPDSTLAGDYNKVKKLSISKNLEIFVIGIEDLIIDRLCACVFWRSENDCLHAKYLFHKFKNEIDIDYLKQKAKQEEVDKKLDEIISEYETISKKHKKTNF